MHGACSLQGTPSATHTCATCVNACDRPWYADRPQVMHRWEVFITRSAEGKSGKAFIGAMTEDKSIELASKLASEGFVFGVSV